MESTNYILGLDIGIASVGWSLLSDDRIIDLGVRIFDRAETPDGESLNLVRRSARLLRRRLARRSERLLRLGRYFKKIGLIEDSLFFKNQIQTTDSTWELRQKALDKKLTNVEWARVIYHICKHRGFWFALKSEAEGSEGGRVKKGLEHTRSLMSQKGYRSPAEMMLAEFPRAQRNKRGDYSQSISRELLAQELELLFDKQRLLGNVFANIDIEATILDKENGFLWYQKPALSGKQMLDLIGKCTFEKTEYRSAKRAYFAERFVWLTKLINLRIAHNDYTGPLPQEAFDAAVNLPFEKAKLSYKQLKKVLVDLDLIPEDSKFTSLNYRSPKDPEEATLIELSGYHKIRKAYADADLHLDWLRLSKDYPTLDKIGQILSIYKTDTELELELKNLSLSQPEVDACLTVSGFNDFIRLSTKALKNILPYMEGGQRYDEACLEAGYNHSNMNNSEKKKYLPKFDENLPKNPVVMRSLNQARKVVNAIIERYGSPFEVHIEMARDLSNPLDERRKIEKEQTKFYEAKEVERSKFREAFGRDPKGREFEKWTLYHEQNGKCAYSIKSLDLNQVIDNPNYCEIDHALPYSRSFDDSKNNKVLALTGENRQKGNLTPFEYLGGKNDSEAWRVFEANVKSNVKYRQAKRDRLLRKSFSQDEASEFKSRNLNDTRYICRYFKNFIEKNLQVLSERETCVVLSGRLTAFLRARWGLVKVREDSDRHHALDATIVAACSQSMVQRLSNYSRLKELEQAKEGFVDYATGEVLNLAAFDKIEKDFPRPWHYFREDLVQRLSDSPGEDTRPIFVSRAPKRRNGGAAHKETIYSQPESLKKSGSVTQKISLANLTTSQIDKLVDQERNKPLYDSLHSRLNEFGGKADKAFAEPFYKLLKDGSPGPEVKTVTLLIEKMSGIPIRKGLAKNDTMIRVDVFTKNKKYHLVPVYVHHTVAKQLPNKAIVADKDEDEWTEIDGSFAFCFSLYPNDLVKITLKDRVEMGYYVGVDRATGALSVVEHDRNSRRFKMGFQRLGVKSALGLVKLHVDLLGRVYEAKPEIRHGLA